MTLTPEQSAAIARIMHEGDTSPSAIDRLRLHLHDATTFDFSMAHDGDDLVFEIDVLLSALEEAQAVRADWQPIETAPKDGTWIELWRTPPEENGPSWAPLIFGRWWRFEDVEIWVWPDDVYDVWTDAGRRRADFAIEEGDGYEASDFTHWRPLTPPPALTPGDKS